MTSGDVTRDLIAEGPRKVFHIGADRDLTLYDGLDVELVLDPRYQRDGKLAGAASGAIGDGNERGVEGSQLFDGGKEVFAGLGRFRRVGPPGPGADRPARKARVGRGLGGVAGSSANTCC